MAAEGVVAQEVLVEIQHQETILPLVRVALVYSFQFQEHPHIMLVEVAEVRVLMAPQLEGLAV
jgi:hypothetical protein